MRVVNEGTNFQIHTLLDYRNFNFLCDTLLERQLKAFVIEHGTDTLS